MRDANLPTAAGMFRNAQGCLTRALIDLDAADDWLRSDWRPVGTELTDAQAELRTRMQREIGAAKEAINRARP